MKKRPGFTIIELLTVVSVMTALIAILVPTLSSARRYAKALVNMKYQRGIVLAANVFACENRDQYPPPRRCTDMVMMVGADRILDR